MQNQETIKDELFKENLKNNAFIQENIVMNDIVQDMKTQQ